ncbi:MAG TPA: hypothetical protein VIW24_15090 [Aldersonia sp.]
MFPDQDIVAAGSGTLADLAPGEVGIGCYPGVTVVSGDRFVFPRPSAAPLAWIRPTLAERTYYAAVWPVRAWGACAIWERAVVRRSFSATRVHIIEDSGLPAVWERGFWAGQHPIEYPLGTYPDPQSLPFDPEVFAAEAARQWFGPEHGDVAINRFRVCEPGSLPVPVVDAGLARRIAILTGGGVRERRRTARSRRA